MKSLSDTELALLCASIDNRQAFSELMKRHRAALLAFLYRLAGDDMYIEDLLQSTFIKAYQKINQYRSEARFKTWLFSIGYREFLQLKRHRKSREKMKASLAKHEPHKNEMKIDTSMDLKRGLDQLTNEERAAILLCDAVGLSNKEAAHAMGSPLGSVKTYIKRARTKMRSFLSGED